jgi:hypothetical protein
MVKINFSISFFPLTGSVKAINPFTSRMPENLQKDFINDYVRKVDDMNLIRLDENTLARNIHAPYKLMIAIASK